jgi:type II secretory pathway component PulK
VWALVLLVFAGALSSLLLARGRSVDAATKADAADLKALYAADGGVELARRRLARDAAWKGEVARVGECEVTVEVEPRAGGWLVRSRAGDTTVKAALREGPGLPAIETYASR